MWLLFWSLLCPWYLEQGHIIDRCPTNTLSVWIKEWTNSPIVPKHGYIGYFCCLRKESKNRHHPVEETGDHDLKRLPTISLEQRMLEKRNCTQELSVKGHIHSLQLCGVLVSIPSKRQKQPEAEMILSRGTWALRLRQFPITSSHLSVSTSLRVLTLNKGSYPPQDICRLQRSQLTQKSSRCPLRRLCGFHVRGRESESTAVCRQLQLPCACAAHCALKRTAQGTSSTSLQRWLLASPDSSLGSLTLAVTLTREGHLSEEHRGRTESRVGWEGEDPARAEVQEPQIFA